MEENQQLRAEGQRRSGSDWQALLGLLLKGRPDVSPPARVSAFLRIFAKIHRGGKAWDIPETIASAIESGAMAIEELEQRADALEAERDALVARMEELKTAAHEFMQCVAAIDGGGYKTEVASATLGALLRKA